MNMDALYAFFQRAIDRLYMRLLMVACRGRVVLVNDANGMQLVQIQFGSTDVADAMPRIQSYGLTSVPMTGAHAVALFIGGDRSNGVVIGDNDLRYRLSGLNPGDVAVYDWRGQKILLSQKGISLSSPIKVVNEAPDIELRATTTLKIDCGGNGTVYTATTRTDYVIGATVSSQNLHPAAIP